MNVGQQEKARVREQERERERESDSVSDLSGVSIENLLCVESHQY